MATNLDIELNAGVLPDLGSAKKAGAALKAEMVKALASLPGEIRDATKVYLSALGTAKTGQSVYNAVSNIRTGIKRGVAVRTALDGFTAEQEDAIRRVDEFVRQRANVLRRVYINEPVNKELSQMRLQTKVEEATKALGRGLSSDFVDKYTAAERAGDTKTLAKLQRQQKTKAIAARTILSNPDLVTDSQYATAMSVLNFQDAVKENTKALKSLTVVATGVATTSFRAIAEAMPTYWHEAVIRSTFGHLEAQAKRTAIAGGAAGSLVGNVLGGIIGNAVAGPAGATVGAGVLGSVGSTIGSLGGKYEGERLQSVQKTIAQINDRYRAQGIYGGQMSVGYAAAVQETGMASAGDVEKMVHNSATLGARMMFGQVGDNEMLMYSLMPGYFAAAMAGKTGSELADAFAADLNRLPPQLRVWAAESVGGGSLGMMAYAASPTFGYVQGQAGSLASGDDAIMRAGAGYHVQGGVRGVLDRIKEQGDIYGDVSYGVRNPAEGVYLPTGDSAELVVNSYRPNEKEKATLFGLPTTVRTMRKLGVLSDSFIASSYYKAASRNVSSEDIEEAGMSRAGIAGTRDRILQHQTININVDGETIKSQEVDNVIQEGTLLTQTLGF